MSLSLHGVLRIRRVPDQYSIVLPSPDARSAAVLSSKRRVQPSTRYLRLARSPRPSRSRELLPSAATTRSALLVVPFARSSSPSGRTPTAAEFVTISTPARCAASARALITFCRTMLNTRLPFQLWVEISRPRPSRVWANGAPFGFQVDDLVETQKRIEANGGKFFFDLGEERHGNFERKFKDPDGVIFDISKHGWQGTDGYTK